MFTFHLTMEEAPDLRALATRLSPVLGAMPELDPVPLEGLHLTMNGVGFTDEVTPERLEEISDRVFQAWEASAVADLRFARMLMVDEGLMLFADAAPWLEALNQAQRKAIDSVMSPRQWGRFQPHVTLAYCASEGDTQHIAQALAPVLADEPDHLWARPTLTLMCLGRDHEVYEWDVLRQV